MLLRQYARSIKVRPPEIGLSFAEVPLTIVQGEFVDIDIDAVRSPGYTKLITLDVLNEPTGLTASFPSGATLGSGVLRRTLRLTAAADAPPVTSVALSITASGDDVATVARPLTVGIEEAVVDPAVIALAISPTSGSTPQGLTRDYTVTLTRTNYTDTVTLAVTGLPTGVTASYPSGQTYTGAATDRIVRLTLAADAPTVTNDQFTVTASGTGVDDATVNATITVTQAEAAGAFTPNRPVGYTELANTTFNSAFDSSPVTGQTTYSYGGFTFTKFAPDKLTSIADATAPNGTGYTSAIKWVNGQGPGQGTVINANGMGSSVRKMYFAWAWKLETGWVNDSTIHKMLYPVNRVDGTNTLHTSFMLGFGPVGTTSSGQVRLRIEQIDRWNGTSFSRSALFGTKTYLTNQWYRWEVEVQMETPGLGNAPQDGILRVWWSEWNGSSWSSPTLDFNRTDLKIGNGIATSTKVFRNNQGLWDMYRGGSGSPTLTADQRMLVDRFHVSTAV